MFYMLLKGVIVFFVCVFRSPGGFDAGPLHARVPCAALAAAPGAPQSAAEGPPLAPAAPHGRAPPRTPSPPQPSPR